VRESDPLLCCLVVSWAESCVRMLTALQLCTGLQRGASTALHKWMVEGLNVGTNITAGAQYMLEAADYYLGGSGTSASPCWSLALPPSPAHGVVLRSPTTRRRIDGQ
jgi:hypothetical protein